MYSINLVVTFTCIFSCAVWYCIKWLATEILEESSSDECSSDAGSGGSDDSDSDDGLLFCYFSFTATYFVRSPSSLLHDVCSEISHTACTL